MSSERTQSSVLFVCLGNICRQVSSTDQAHASADYSYDDSIRSPLAEAVFQHLVTERKLSIKVDSCGTAGYHVGGAPDERSVGVRNLLND